MLKIGELARRAGVSIPTLKHYLREGLIAPARKTGKTMAWYEPALVERVKAIRELRSAQFLPLDVIKQALNGSRPRHNSKRCEDIGGDDHGGGSGRVLQTGTSQTYTLLGDVADAPTPSPVSGGAPSSGVVSRVASGLAGVVVAAVSVVVVVAGF